MKFFTVQKVLLPLFTVDPILYLIYQSLYFDFMNIPKNYYTSDAFENHIYYLQGSWRLYIGIPGSTEAPTSIKY